MSRRYMHTRVHPAAARQPHVAYTDHVNTSWSARIVVFYGELDFSPSVEGTRARYFVAAKTIFHVPPRHDTTPRSVYLGRSQLYITRKFSSLGQTLVLENKKYLFGVMCDLLLPRNADE